jgi:hypothetical protein
MYIANIPEVWSGANFTGISVFSSAPLKTSHSVEFPARENHQYCYRYLRLDFVSIVI